MGWRKSSTSSDDYEQSLLKHMTPEEIKEFRRKQRPMIWATSLLLLVAYLLALAVCLLLLPLLVFRLLPCLYAKKIRAVAEGVVVYSLLGGEDSRHAWSDIEAFWIFPISGGFPAIQQWQLVLKDRRTIPLPLVRGKTIWKICESRGIPTNLWDIWPPEEREIRKTRYLPGGRYLF